MHVNLAVISEMSFPQHEKRVITLSFLVVESSLLLNNTI